MRIFRYPPREPSLSCWGWRMLFGPSCLVDGLVETLTLGFVGVGCRLAVSRNLAGARIRAQKLKAAANSYPHAKTDCCR